MENLENTPIYENNNFALINDNKPYTAVTTCVIDHIIFAKTLTATEKLFYLLSDILSQIKQNTEGYRKISLSSKQWVNLLFCSKNHILTMQKKLENKGYFNIVRDQNNKNQNQRNIIIPTLPDNVFNELSSSGEKKYKVKNLENDKTIKCKRTLLDNIKMFIKLNYNLFISVIKSVSISSTAKIA